MRPEKRNILSTKKEETILSVKGTVRGVKNRVRAGIATFLQEQDEKVTYKRCKSTVVNISIFRTI